METSRHPKACYLMLKSYDDHGGISWVSHVRTLLMETGFSYVLISQECGDIPAFMQCFKQRCHDIQYQLWHSKLCSSSYLHNYCSYKSILEPEIYILSLFQIETWYVLCVSSDV